MLALAALIGADGRVPTMVLQRAPLGRHGSYIATVLNIAQCLGWAIFELIVIATAAGLLATSCSDSKRLRPGSSSSAARSALALMGRSASCAGSCASLRSGRSRCRSSTSRGGSSRRERRHAVVEPRRAPRLVLARGRHGDRGHRFLGALVADYTCFSRDRRSAFFGVGIGYLLPTLFQFGFGSILVLSRGVDPNRPELILTAIAGGGAAAALALLALTWTRRTRPSRTCTRLRCRRRTSSHAYRSATDCRASIIATAGALAIDMRSYQRSCCCSVPSSSRCSACSRRLAVQLSALLAARLLRSPASASGRSPRGRPASWSTSGCTSRPASVSGRPDGEASDARVPDRRLAPELRARVRADRLSSQRRVPDLGPIGRSSPSRARGQTNCRAVNGVRPCQATDFELPARR